MQDITKYSVDLSYVTARYMLSSTMQYFREFDGASLTCSRLIKVHSKVVRCLCEFVSAQEGRAARPHLTELQLNVQDRGSTQCLWLFWGIVFLCQSMQLRTFENPKKNYYL